MCAVPTSVISCRAVCTTLTHESHSALGSARAGAAAAAADADADADADARRSESGAVARSPDSPPTAHLRLRSGCGRLLGRVELRGAAGSGTRRQSTAAGSSRSMVAIACICRAPSMYESVHPGAVFSCGQRCFGPLGRCGHPCFSAAERRRAERAFARAAGKKWRFWRGANSKKGANMAVQVQHCVNTHRPID